MISISQREAPPNGRGQQQHKPGTHSQYPTEDSQPQEGSSHAGNHRCWVPKATGQALGALFCIHVRCGRNREGKRDSTEQRTIQNIAVAEFSNVCGLRGLTSGIPLVSEEAYVCCPLNVPTEIASNNNRGLLYCSSRASCPMLDWYFYPSVGLAYKYRI